MSRLQVAAPLAGFALPLSKVPDPVFAQGLAGDGVAIDPVGETLHAPCRGTVMTLPAGRHALSLDCGAAQLLMHVGIDTVALRGSGFELLVRDGDRVEPGQPLMRFSLDRIARGAPSAVTPILVSGPAGATISRRATGRLVAVGDFLFEVGALAVADSPAATSQPSDRRTFIVPFEHGLHARPAALVAAALKGLDADVVFAAHGREANARSAVAMMTLGVHAGEAVEVLFTGRDAAAACGAIERLLATPSQAVAARPVRAPDRASGALRGVTAVRGLAIGVAVPLSTPDISVVETSDDPAAEQRALDDAIAAVLKRLESRAAETRGLQHDILVAHAELVTDPELARRAVEAIGRGSTAAFAFREAVRESAATLAALPDARLRERAADLRDVGHQVVAELTGTPHQGLQNLPEHAILIAEELWPSQLIGLDASRLAGLATSGGGATSHVAIIAAAMGIPAVVALGAGVLAIRPGAALVLDADAAVLNVDPDPAAMAAARSQMESAAALQRRDRARAGEPATTTDGVHIAVYCNVGSAAEAAAAVEQGAEGCGLLRTEFLFLDRREPPDESEQAEVYSQVARALGGRPLSIRTLDAGGDKPIAYLPQPHEDNPALGLRGLRTSLARPDLLATQLRAILRTGHAGPCRILLPMVTEVAEVRTVREALDVARSSLGPGPMPPMGVMIETPSSALLAEQLVREVDFVSIGTNDLSQYALAMDRTHPELARRLDAMHPAVLRLIDCAAAAARAHGREAAVCGGLGSDPVAVPVLIGLGIRELSAVPAMIPRIKGLIRELRVVDCEALAREAIARSSAADVRELASLWLGSRGLLSGAMR